MKKYLCEQSCYRENIRKDLEALTVNSGSTCMTLGRSLNISVSLSLFLPLSFSLCSFIKRKCGTRWMVFKLCSMQSVCGLLISLGPGGWVLVLPFFPGLFSFSFPLVTYHALLQKISSEESILVAKIIKSLNHVIWKPTSSSMTVFTQVHKHDH